MIHSKSEIIRKQINSCLSVGRQYQSTDEYRHKEKQLSLVEFSSVRTHPMVDYNELNKHIVF